MSYPRYRVGLGTLCSKLMLCSYVLRITLLCFLILIIRGGRKELQGSTVFPRNPAAARFNFKAPYHAATIQGQHPQRSTHTRVHSFSDNVCTYCACAHTYSVYRCQPRTMWQDFKGGVDLAEICNNILRAAEF